MLGTKVLVILGAWQRKLRAVPYAMENHFYNIR